MSWRRRVCAVLAGACTFAAVADWMRFQDESVWTRLGFDGRVPAATTVWRLLIRLDAEVLSQVLACWLRERAGPVVIGGRRGRLVIAIDGKVARGARSPTGGRCICSRPTTPAPGSCSPRFRPGSTDSGGVIATHR
ncbi:transposase family protein [Micromonospora sp. WMMA1363]|uniref:transposase family protein n=1 Tax=Micromonospora sp. WMMA1363 TaxID=3053985 RepID=UPI00259D27E0|nr:transposase family protein [Micromonospora sp. WMMA1363]MDM4723429.1 transposase family protein [Micromonospora sp. WMMA1363]